ncbi:MAG TPA: Holliday junction branch migration protein RuvA [Bacteroidales bacterium]|nr:Holliday junction branch migration protein RuvA [Bacteroidales bacterium]HPT10827.1 Holliday junction branch migration protein RuvA [Bacteroidales bacterium]
MYEFIKGKLVEKNPGYAVVEAGGIGYLLNISIHTYSVLKEDEACMLYTHLVVREDDMLLYGFAEPGERELFRQLITVSGVGVNTARMILSSLSPEEVYEAIAAGDSALLQRVKGIGGKTAQRIIIDLKDKVSRELIPHEKSGFLHNTKKEEALSGLIILGFPKMVAEKALSRVIDTEGTSLTVEQLIKQALKIL